MTQSLWCATQYHKERPGLSHDLEADVAVIGGGMAGVLTAYFLKERGRRPVILEAGRLGGGQTQNTTAKITAQHGLCYHTLIQRHGADKARQYARANQQAIDRYRTLSERLGADCWLESCPAYLYSCTGTQALEQEYRAAQTLGLDAALVTETELPFPVRLALRFDHQARFHPLKFLQAAAAGLTVFEQTKVRRVEGDRIETDRGTVRAGAVVFATHYPFPNVPGYYFMRMHQSRSYVLALEQAPLPEGMYYGVDPSCGWSVRSAGNYLLLGGGSHRTGENGAGGQYAALKEAAAAFWPGSRAAAMWSAQDCMPMDGVPYIGPFSAAAPRWFVATGFQKWGMTSSMAAAEILAALVCGEDHPCREVFSPLRFTPAASAGQLLEDGLKSVKALSRQWLAVPRARLDALPAGQGGILTWEGRKVGAYRDQSGTVFLVDPKCPHLGCQLAWNPEEKSWDCPCHGSRFDYKGHLIDNPAQRGLHRP